MLAVLGDNQPEPAGLSPLGLSKHLFTLFTAFIQILIAGNISKYGIGQDCLLPYLPIGISNSTCAFLRISRIIVSLAR